jgi:hypothetical protein
MIGRPAKPVNAKGAGLLQGLAFAQLERLDAAQEKGFAALDSLLKQQAQRLETLLGELQALVVETHEAVLDLVARLRLLPGVPPPSPGVTDLVALIHIVVENRPSAAALRPRMFDYYVQLRRDTRLPVWPIGLYLRVGLEGAGWDAYEEFFWEHRILRFEYAYVGLPGLDGEHNATGEHLLGVALSTLMRVPPERRAELFAEGLKRIARSGENDWRRFLLAECLEAYADLDASQKERLRTLLTTPPYQEVKPIVITTYERGKLAGRFETALQ